MRFAPTRQSLRPLLLALVVFTALGLVPELLLLKHYDSATQLIPYVALLATLATATLAWRQPTPRTIAAFRAVMWLTAVVGIVGVILHAKGNWEWALERDDTLRGWPLVWKILRGATPLLAPGAMTQLGLLGLIYTYRHPALERGPHLKPEIS